MRKKVTRIGVGGPVGSGKTAIVEAITPRLLELGIKVLIITNDVVTTEDAKHVQRTLKGILLEERERKVLEDELLAGLAQQIHSRVIAARDLVREMDADTRSKPMSSGIAVGIRWAQSDKITDRQRAASRLLERAAPGPARPTSSDILTAVMRYRL